MEGGVIMPGYVIGNFFVYSIINAFTPGPGNILALNTVTNFTKGFFLQFVNVKIYLFGITALTGWLLLCWNVYMVC